MSGIGVVRPSSSSSLFVYSPGVQLSGPDATPLPGSLSR